MHEIRTIMTTDVVSVREDTPIQHVVELLVEHDITGIPVVDADDRLVGIVTEKDLMGLLSNPGQTTGTAADYMTRDVVCFDVEDDVISVCECLVRSDFRRVPIISNGRLVGIISRRDLLKYIVEPIGTASDGSMSNETPWRSPEFYC
jgi:CBS domain-containing protein